VQELVVFAKILVHQYPLHPLMRATMMLTVVGMMFKDVDIATTTAAGWATRALVVTRATWRRVLRGGVVDLLGLIQHIQGMVTSQPGTIPNAVELAIRRLVYQHPHQPLMRATTMLTVVGMMFKDVDDAMTTAAGWATRALGVTRAT